MMRAGISKLSDLADGAGALASILAAGGNVFYCDPTNGTAGGVATSPETANTNLQTVFDMTTANHNDVVFFIGGATAYNPAAAFDWSHNYTHLIGLSSPLLGKGQRCRVVAQAGVALTQAMTISASGCIFSNLQFNNEKASGASGSAVVTGLRNYFENCFFMNPTSVTAASWALKVTASENNFIRCSVGQITNVRTAASYGLYLATVANSLKFIGCEFQSWCDTTTHVPVYIDSDITSEGWQLQFEACLFQNLGAGTLAVAIDDNSTAPYHQIIFRGRDNLCVKCSAVADPLTYTFAPDAEDTVSGLLAIAVLES